MAEVSVTYYAGIADRLGVSEDVYKGVATAGDLTERVITRHGEDVRASLEACSLLSNVGRLQPEDELSENMKIDVLPPFAGG